MKPCNATYCAGLFFFTLMNKCAMFRYDARKNLQQETATGNKDRKTEKS